MDFVEGLQTYKVGHYLKQKPSLKQNLSECIFLTSKSIQFNQFYRFYPMLVQILSDATIISIRNLVIVDNLLFISILQGALDPVFYLFYSIRCQFIDF